VTYPFSAAWGTISKIKSDFCCLKSFCSTIALTPVNCIAETLSRLIPMKRKVSPCLEPVGPKLSNSTFPELGSSFLSHDVSIAVDKIKHINATTREEDNFII
jgi:hypothetical protein